MATKETLTVDIFDQICDDFANNCDIIKNVLDKYNVTTYQFYKMIGSDQAKASQYVLARVQYIENRVHIKRNQLNTECLIEIRRNPKAANAIAAHYRDMIRQIEWDAEKLIPKTYGNKVDMGDNAMKIIMVNQNNQST